MDFCNSITHAGANTTMSCLVGVVAGSAGGLVITISLIITILSVICIVQKKKKKARCEGKKTKHETSTAGTTDNQQDLNSPSYTTEFGVRLSSSHDYASVHLPGNSPSDLEKGGRYNRVAWQEPINNYDDPTPTSEQMMDIIPTHGYDVPKPQSRAIQPPLNVAWGAVQGYETPQNAVVKKNKLGYSSSKLSPDGKRTSNANADDEYVHPYLLRRNNDCIIDASAPSRRKVSNESTLSSNVPLPRERHSPKAAMSTHGSYDHLGKLPHQQQFPSYENIDKDGFIIGQAPPILNSPHENPIGGGNVAKTVTPVKLELKKPAIPSRLFKPTAELKQIQQDANSKERKRRFEPLTPKDTGKKSVYDQPAKGKHARSQTWTLDDKININSKPPRASNYTPIDPTTMDPNNDYEQV